MPNKRRDENVDAAGDSNSIGRTASRALDVVPRLLCERSGMSSLFAVLPDGWAWWHRVKLTPADLERLDALRKKAEWCHSEQLMAA
jgi:hypothetical protein